MRNTLLVLLCVLGLSACTANAQQHPLVSGGKSPYVLVLSAQASLSEKRGTEEIRSNLADISGAKLQVIDDSQALPDSAILIGQSRHTDSLGLKLDPSLGPEGFIIKSAGKHIVILGSRVRGTMYGCTTFLEKLGVRWYTPTVRFFPTKTDISLPVLDERQVPAFEYREAFFFEAFDKDWAARMKFNGNSERLDESTGGKIKYHHFVHSFDDLVPRALFKEHPEYFPVIKGKRTDGYVQRCLTNPDVLKMSIEAVQRWIKERPDATIYSVSQNDTYNFCECDQCKAVEAKFGGKHSGLYLWFVNQVAEAIEKDHPDKLIDTLAYQFTEEPPTGIVPRKNVRVRLCPISVCEAHPYEQCTHKNTIAFVKALQGWSKITDTLYIWHYNTCFTNYLMPFPDFEEFPADTRLYQKAGVIGIFFQGAYESNGGSDAEMRSYVMSRLLWNPSVDANEIVNEWMRGVFGPAEKPMRQWFDLLHEKARQPDKYFFIFDSPNVHYLSADVVAKGDELFDEAQKLAAGNSVAEQYVAKARMWLRYVKLMQKPAAGPEFESFLADLKKFNIVSLREGTRVDWFEREYRKKIEAKK